MSKKIISQVEYKGKGFSEPVPGTYQVLVDVNERGRDRRWGVKKSKNVKMYGIIERANDIYKSEGQGLFLLSDNTLYNINHCGDFLLFDHFEDGSKKLAAASFCKHRLCPMCNWRKSIKLFGQTSEIVAHIQAFGTLDAKHKNCKSIRFIFVTFTIRNVTAEELPDALNKMNEAFKSLVQPAKKYKAAAKLQKNLLGYMKAIEITYNQETDTYHPHIHSILEVASTFFKDGYLSMNDWRDLWKGAMKLDYTPQVDAKAIRNADGKSNTPDPGAVAEIAKYPVKVDGLLQIQDIDKAARAVITLQTVCNHRRFVTFGGDFRKVARKLKLEDVETGDLVHTETNQEIKVGAVYQTLWRYNARLGLYIN